MIELSGGQVYAAAAKPGDVVAHWSRGHVLVCAVGAQTVLAEVDPWGRVHARAWDGTVGWLDESTWTWRTL